jgi:PmbA protein
VTGAPRSGLPLEEDRATRAAQHAFNLEGAEGVEVVVAGSNSGITRYANSEIIQNTVRAELRIYVRVALADRSATAATNQLDEAHIRGAAERALAAARAAPPDPEWPGLATPDEAGDPQPLWCFDEKTAGTPPEERARIVSDVLKASQQANAAGVCETNAQAFGVFSSTGIGCFDGFTRGVVTCLVDTGSATGWAEVSSHAIAEVDHLSAVGRALDKAGRGPAVAEAPPGDYVVVLEPAAAGALVDYLAWSSFGAKFVIDGESFLATKAGRKVAAQSVTVNDDVAHPLSVGIGFDFEGVARRRVAVIDSGVATQPVTDRRTARKLGLPVTGHGSGSDEWGPFAVNVVLEPGDKDFNQMVSSVDDGLLVTRFHYVNVLDRPSTLLTGMTRDGIFRIRHGEIAEPVQNLRFTQSALEALESVEEIGSDSKGFAPEFGSFGSTVAPSMRVDGFRFTSKTSH